MWLFTVYGMFSCVRCKTTGGMLLRARDRDHLDRLKAATGLDGKIHSTPMCDYHYRMIITNEEFQEVIAQLACEIDWGNFKSAVHDRMGSCWYGSVLIRVWDIVLDAAERACGR